MAILNAGGLYSPMIPNCSCIYKYDNFYRLNPNHINLPGSNFYNYSTHSTGEIPQSGDPQVPDWKSENSKFYATSANPTLSWKSTIPLGVVFFYGTDDGSFTDGFTIKFSSNDNYIQHKYIINQTENTWQLNITDSNNSLKSTSGGFSISAGDITFTEVSTSESGFKNFAVYGNSYYMPTQQSSGIFNYSIELQNASTGCYISSMVLQRNTLECLNLNNENTRLLPNQIVYPTGYFSIFNRNACISNLQTVFGFQPSISFMKDRYYPFTGFDNAPSFGTYYKYEDSEYYINVEPEESNYKTTYSRSGFLKTHNINNNYCVPCYELKDKFIQIKSNPDEEIARLDSLILDKTNEIEQAGDNPVVLIDELNKLNEEKELVLNIKNFDSASWQNWYNSYFRVSNINNFSDTAENIIPHNRGISLPSRNPCLSVNPRVILDIENGIIDTGYAYKAILDKSKFSGLTSSQEPQIVEFDDIDISGTYELLPANENVYLQGDNSDLFFHVFPVTVENEIDSVNVYVVLLVRVGINYIDIETGLKRHYANCKVYCIQTDDSSVIDNPFIYTDNSSVWTLTEFVVDEWTSSLSDICQNSHSMEILSPNLIEVMRSINNFIPYQCGDIVYCQSYTEVAEVGARDCDSSDPYVSQTVFNIGGNLSDNDGQNSCSNMSEKTEYSGITPPVLGGNYVVKWQNLEYEYRACNKMTITIRAE